MTTEIGAHQTLTQASGVDRAGQGYWSYIPSSSFVLFIIYLTGKGSLQKWIAALMPAPVQAPQVGQPTPASTPGAGGPADTSRADINRPGMSQGPPGPYLEINPLNPGFGTIKQGPQVPGVPSGPRAITGTVTDSGLGGIFKWFTDHFLTTPAY